MRHEISSTITRTFNVKSENETIRLAEYLATYLQSGDTVTLSGDLGTGKTIFARSLIRFIIRQPTLKITSPTFLLLHEYEGEFVKVVHADLYRLTNPDELTEIGFDEIFRNSVAVVEWPERYPKLIETAKASIKITSPEANDQFFRIISVTADEYVLNSIEQQIYIDEFLTKYNWNDAVRELIAGDASGRRYERLRKEFYSVILMICPKEKSEPIIKNNQNYKSIAKLSMSIKSFIAVANGLSNAGFSAPNILGFDIKNGLILSEDLGADLIYNSDGPIVERYQEAVRFLGTLHTIDLAQRIPLYGDISYEIPKYDIDALLIEAELLLDWYIPYATRNIIVEKERIRFLDIWRKLLEPMQKEPHGWTLRDFHSPNILWLSQRLGVKKVGLIDIQDTVWGHRAYDLASLLQDARVSISAELEIELYNLYLHIRIENDKNFDITLFSKSYAICALQRLTKILGIFVRLHLRDHKTEYLKYIPNLIVYFHRNLSHPALSEYREWIRIHCPALLNNNSKERRLI
jgi:tRNA threonylcarbamoyl adenosine modification protein YjeE